MPKKSKKRIKVKLAKDIIFNKKRELYLVKEEYQEYWSFAGGHQKRYESKWMCSGREVEEEVEGIRIDASIRYGKRIKVPDTETSEPKYIQYYLMRAGRIRGQGGNEVEKGIWANYDKLKRMYANEELSTTVTTFLDNTTKAEFYKLCSIMKGLEPLINPA